MGGMDPHIAALVGLDLNDPEDVAAIAKAEAEDAAIDRQNKLNAGLVLGQALGHHEAREKLDQLGYYDGIHLIPLNLGGLEKHLPPEAVVEAAFELATAKPEERETITAAWCSTAEVYADPVLLAALTRESHEDGGRVTLPEPFADTDLDGPEARQTVLGADDYQRLLDSLDEADRAHGLAMRARKRGGTET